MKYSFRKIAVSISMFAVIVFVLSYAAYASYEVKILINGENLICRENPVIIEGSTLVPMRDVFEALGAEVKWNDAERSASGLRDGVLVTIFPDSGEVLKNGEKLDIPSGSRIINDRLMIPLRAVAESFGYSVMWNGKDYTVSISDSAPLKTHFLDCGQADCMFIELPDGKCMLIDAGESAFGEGLADFIRSMGYSKIDYVVATHPHSDHIGAMAYILENFVVEEFFMPEVSHNTKTFENMLDALSKNGCKCSYVSAGSVIEDSLYGIYVLAPLKTDYSRMNNYSAVIKLEYKGVSTVFSGDAEIDSEEEMISGGTDIDADVLKIGHHGSATSSMEEYIDAVSPESAIISVGDGNSYGFPSVLVTNRLEKRGIDIWRTDKNGNIRMITDGYIYVIESDK